MCCEHSDHRPEENERNHIGTISILIIESEQEGESENSDSPIHLSDAPTRESERDEPDSDIGNGRDIDPPECELYTASNEKSLLSRSMKGILEHTEDGEHDDERNSDHIIRPRHEPYGGESDSERIGKYDR